MKSIFDVAAIALAATMLTFSASGASLLGGLITTGADSGNSGSPISLGSSGDTTSLGLLGSGGAALRIAGSGLDARDALVERIESAVDLLHVAIRRAAGKSQHQRRNGAGENTSSHRNLLLG